MPTLVHELHPQLVHAPLVLLPVSAVVELRAATARWPRSIAFDRLGRRLWWATAGAALGAGLAGLAASQEVRVEDQRAHAAMFVHGLGNVTLLAAAIGLASWRSGHRASATTAALGLGAVAGSIYTAWLGGNLVYAHGLGVKSSFAGPGDLTPLYSREAPARLARDAAAGLAWLVRRALGGLGGRHPVHTPAITPGHPQATEPVVTRPGM
jgi:uncharacterized membrane protein